MNGFCDEVLHLLWQTTWQSTIVLLLILLMRGLFGRWIGSRWKHALWGLLLLRLLLPVLPQNRFSVYAGSYRFLCSCDACVAHLIDVRSRATQASRLQGGENRSGHVAPTVFTVVYGDTSKAGRLSNPSPSEDIRQPVSHRNEVAVSVWLLIALGAIVFRIIANHRFLRRLSTSNAVCLPRVNLALESARRELRLSRLPNLILTGEVDSPAVTGLLRPIVLLPIGLAEQITDDQLRLVLLHELSHIKCGDIAMDWLWAIAQSLHWFNPMLWMMSPLRRTDREMARDEMVLRMSGPQQAECYGRTLIELSRPARLLMFCPGLIGIGTGNRSLRRRVTEIGRFGSQPRRFSGLIGLGLMIAAGCGMLTSPKSAGDTAVTVAAHGPSPATQTSGDEIVTRRYDVNDLVFIASDYANAPNLGLNEGDRTDVGLFTDGVLSPPPRSPDRATRIDDLRKYIMDNADPGTWKEDGGSVGSISSDPARPMFLITQTTSTHARIQAVLDDLRTSHGKQLSIECHILSLDESAERKLRSDLRGRLASVRNAGRYRRDEFLGNEQVAQLMKAVSGDAQSLVVPRLTIFNGQHAALVMQTQQAYVGDLKKVIETGKNPQHPWLWDPIVKTCTAEGLVFNVVACTSPDNSSAFVDVNATFARLLGLIPEKFGPGHDDVEGTIQRPVMAMFKVNAACGIPDQGTLLLGGSETIESGDPKFNADSPSRPATDAQVKQMTEQQSHRHLYVLIKPTILLQNKGRAVGNANH